MARRRYKCGKLSAAVKRAAFVAAGSPKAPRGCKVVYFGKPGCRSAKAVVRCSGKEGGMSRAAKSRWRRQVHAGELCLRKIGRGKRVRISKRC
jgi:hypothetical protein